MSLSDVLNITSPENHCDQDHDHDALPWGLPGCPWQELLDWATKDEGFNEGAAAGAEIALQYGFSLPAQIAHLGGAALADVWHRSAMMQFAVLVAKSGQPLVGTAIAIASQWNNCHAFKCLVFHSPEVTAWLLQQ
jgi:hypothetical protein